MVDKFIGDAMMAVFNAPLDQEHHEEEAINAGIQIIHNMQKANEELERRGIEERIKIGIGINSGYAVIGNMGSDTRFDYSCIGDSVNLAARLESSTKTVGKDLLIGESTKERSKRSLIKLDPIEVKGKEKLINLYTIDDSAV
jgi:adenylate cyclase